MTETFQLPTRRVRATARLEGGRCLQAQLFLGISAPGHEGAESVGDVLAQPSRFLPLVDEQTGHPVLVAKTALLALELDTGEAPIFPDDGSIELEVRFSLRDGSSLQGRVRYALPHERSRLSDFLNCAPAFVRVFTAEGERWISLAHVAAAEPLEH